MTEGIQFLTPDSGLSQLETKTILSGLRSKLKIRVLTTKTFKVSYQLKATKTMLNHLLELIATVPVRMLTELQAKRPTSKLILKLRETKERKKKAMMMRRKNEQFINSIIIFKSFTR